MSLEVGKKFVIEKRIAGSLSKVYPGTVIATGEPVAIKVESTTAHSPQLGYEAKVYRALQGGAGIPSLRWYGVEGQCHVMVTDLLGASLERLFIQRGQRFSLKTVLLIADQLLQRVEYMHSKSFIHRDLKPDSFLVGGGADASTIYVIDFRLTKRYRDHKTHVHMMYRDNKQLTGAARYASINNHLGIEQSRRDDVETLGYVLVYFLRGSLPWQGIHCDSHEEKYLKIMEKKISTPIKELCAGLPPEFVSYLEYCRSLGFEDTPDYAYLRDLFKKIAVREGVEYDGRFDWIPPPESASVSASAAASGEDSKQVEVAPDGCWS